MSCVWMKVTKDKYELPLVVADSCKELASMCDVAISTIVVSVKRCRDNPQYTSQYVKVEISEDDE